MKLSSGLACLFMLFSKACGLYFLNTDWSGITTDKTFHLRWAGDSTPVTLSLFHGPDGNKQWVRNITANQEGNSYDWTPKEFLPAGHIYNLRIYQGAKSWWSPAFNISSNIAQAAPTVTFYNVTVAVHPSIVGAGNGNDASPSETAQARLVFSIQGRAEGGAREPRDRDQARSQCRKEGSQPEDADADAGDPDASDDDQTEPDADEAPSDDPASAQDCSSAPLPYNPGGPMTTSTSEPGVSPGPPKSEAAQGKTESHPSTLVSVKTPSSPQDNSTAVASAGSVKTVNSTAAANNGSAAATSSLPISATTVGATSLPSMAPVMAGTINLRGSLLCAFLGVAVASIPGVLA